MASTALVQKLGDSGAAVGEYGGAATFSSFGSPAQELAAVRTGVGVFDLGWRGKLVISGEDRVRWLNGMVTNNTRDLAVNHGNYSFLLNPQGRIQADLMAFQRGDFYLITSSLSQLSKIQEFFDRYIIMDDVEVGDISEKLTSIGIAGPRAVATLAQLGLDANGMQPGEIRDLFWQGTGVSVVRDPIEARDWYEVWISPENAEPFWKAAISAGATPVGYEALEWQRILVGLPTAGVDIRDKDLPQETSQLYALHYAKGCYIGQEIVERIHSRGNVHRGLSGLRVEGPWVAAGTKISLDGKDVGEITSSAEIPANGATQTFALGYMRREASSPGTQVQVGESRATVSALPFEL